MISRILIAICLYFISFNFAYAADRAEQRAMFLQAKMDLANGNYAGFSQLSEQLKDYSLYPYLRFADLEQQLDQLSEEQVVEFMDEYADTPLANKLREDWLDTLAEQQKWPLFIKYYQQTSNVQLQCGYLQALLASGNEEQVFKAAPKLWLVGHAQPAACESVFFAWQKSGKLPQELLWKRIELAFDRNNSVLITQLAPWLPSAAQAQVKLWQQVRINPGLVTQADLFTPFNYRTKQILLDGIDRLAKKNPDQVVELWPTLQTTYSFDVSDQQKIIRMIAVALARNTDTDAMAWLEKIEPAYVTQVAGEWRIRIALLNKDWEQVNHWISKLNPSEQQTNAWRYWHARALAELGRAEAARAIYQSLATQIDYYGLLASQQLHQAYSPANRTIAVNDQMITKLANAPALQRAHELYILNMQADARREWQWQMAKIDKTQLAAAAQLAAQWHWYDRMLVTAGKANLQNDIALRFPLAFRQEILTAAKQTGLDPSWLFAIMRQESAFIPDVKSSVGALGLMQLMPKTAELLMNSLHLNIDNNLLNANTNIQLGSHYLKDLSVRFAGNKTIATAAYNLGPTRLKKYMPLYEQLGQDIWVEILPWQETRGYVKNVMLNRAIYQQQLSKK